MPETTAGSMPVGQVLIDPDGTMYEVVAKTRFGNNEVAMWLWKDDEAYPAWFQVFLADDVVNFVRSGPSTEPHVAEVEQTESIPLVASTTVEGVQVAQEEG